MTTRPTHIALSLSLLTAAALLPGCGNSTTEGGWLGSYDNYTYVSTSWQPKTVTLFDTRTGESLWSVDIPVGKQLNLGFRKGTGPNEYKPDEMVWEIKMGGRIFGSRDNKVPVPPHTARRVEMTLRAAPEMPRAEMPGNPYAGGVKPKTGPSEGSTKVDPRTTLVPPVVPVEQPKGPELQPQPEGRGGAPENELLPPQVEPPERPGNRPVPQPR
jgi:hypothetical protein